MFDSTPPPLPSFGSAAAPVAPSPTARSPSATAPTAPTDAPDTAVVATCYSPAHRLLTVARRDSTLLQYHLPTHNIPRTIATDHPPTTITCLAPSPKSQAFASASSTGTVLIHNYPARRPPPLMHSSPVRAMAFSDTGLLAVVTVDATHVYSHRNWKKQALVDVTAASVSFAPASRFLVVGTTILRCFANTIHTWHPYVQFPISDVLCVDWARTGHLAVARKNGSIEIWILVKGHLNFQLLISENTNHICDIKWDHSAMSMATTHSTGAITMWAKIYEADNLKWTKTSEVQI